MTALSHSEPSPTLSVPGLDLPGLPRRVDAALQKALDEARVVGAVALVAHEGRLVVRRAVGLADREAGRPMQPETPFRLASLTKPIVSVAALALVGEGKLDLDAPITRWLPHFRPRTADGVERVIRVRHLLTHTSGLGYGMFESEGDAYARAGVSNGLDQPGLSFEENARRLASVPLLTPPGTAFPYSLSTDVLGEVVARAADRPLPEVVAERVTRPLGLRETSFAARDATRLAAPYADAQPVPERMQEGHHVVHFTGGVTSYAPARALVPGSYPSGGAGMIGTADEYVVFLEALRTDDTRLLGRPLFDAMKTDQLAPLPPASVLQEGWGFGYGVAVLRDPARAGSWMRPGAFRWEGAYGHRFWVDPRAGLSVVLLTNTAVEGMFGALAADLERAVYTTDAS